MKSMKDDKILKVIANMVVPFIILFGIFVMLNGHISPGGGFSGGTIFGAGLIFYHLAFSEDNLDFKKLINFKTMTYVNVFALVGISAVNIYSFIVGSMGWRNILPLGTPGAILSATVVLLLDIFVGIKVAATMYELYAIFKEGEV